MERVQTNLCTTMRYKYKDLHKMFLLLKDLSTNLNIYPVIPTSGNVLMTSTTPAYCK